MIAEMIAASQPVHFVGVGGVGMAGLARLLRQKGGRVSGSDRTDNILTRELAEIGVKIYSGHDRNHIPDDIHWAVRTPAVSGSNPEIEFLRSRHLPVYSRGEVLAAVANSRRSLAVAGAHGKTTTSAMLCHILRNCGIAAGYAIGGETSFPGRVADTGAESAPFVVEADESDGTLIHYRPEVGVLTHVEWDHVERFPSEQALHACYRRFVTQAQEMWIREEDTLSCDLCRDHPKVKKVGRSEDADLQLTELASTVDGVQFGVRRGNEQVCCHVPIPGEHNAWNAMLALGAACDAGVDLPAAARSLGSFAGVGRRFQKKLINGIQVIQDYAHHPTELKAVLNSVHALRPQNVWMVFQPHRYSRTRHLLADFAEVLSRADHLALLPVYGAFEHPEQGADSHALAEACRGTHPEVKVWSDWQELENRWKNEAMPGDVILIAGAGTIESLWKNW